MGGFFQKSKLCKDDDQNIGIVIQMEGHRWVLIGKKIYILCREGDGDDEQRGSWLGEPCSRSSDKEKQSPPNSKQRLVLCKARKACLYSF